MDRKAEPTDQTKFGWLENKSGQGRFGKVLNQEFLKSISKWQIDLPTLTHCCQGWFCRKTDSD